MCQDSCFTCVSGGPCLFLCLQPRKPPDEERQFKHDSELKDLNVMEKKEEVGIFMLYMSMPTMHQVVPFVLYQLSKYIFVSFS